MVFNTWEVKLLAMLLLMQGRNIVLSMIGWRSERTTENGVDHIKLCRDLVSQFSLYSLLKHLAEYIGQVL